jgi:hypothetical protein
MEINNKCSILYNQVQVQMEAMLKDKKGKAQDWESYHEVSINYLPYTYY